MITKIDSLLNQKQQDFLYSNNLINVVDEDTATMIFLKDLFDVKVENNPLKESIFFAVLFEFVTCFLHLYSPSSLIEDSINAKNRYRLISIIPYKNEALNSNSNLLDNFNEPILKLDCLAGSSSIIKLKYTINPLQRKIDLIINIKDIVLRFSYDLKVKPKILSHSFECEVKDPLELLYKIINIYEELVDVMV